MRFNFLNVLIICFCPFILFAQNNKNFGSFAQSININEFAGRGFSIEANMKINRIEPYADITIFTQMQNRNNEQIFFQSSSSDQGFILFNQWKKVSIKGTIPDGASRIIIGGTFSNKAFFYFDNFKLSIQDSKGNFQQIKMQNADFENDVILTEKSWVYFQPLKEYKLEKDTSSFISGKYSLRVSDSKLIKQNIIGDNDSTGKYIAVNGIDVYYETYGTGEPLILLHGNSESIASFKNQIPELSKYYKVIAIDTRGQGKSSEDGKKYTYDLFAEDLKTFLDCMKLDKVNILGWSDGGNTGLIAAIKYPDKINKLITMGANIFIDNTVIENKIFKALNKQIKAQSKDSLYYAKNSVRLKTLLLTEPRHTFEELDQIKIPTLIMAGEHDIIKEAPTKGIAAGIKNSTLKIVKNETHEFPQDNPKYFNEIVLGFFKK